MDKATFTERILKQIHFVISATERQTTTIIEARKGRVDQESFKKWLIEERDKLLISPEINVYGSPKKEMTRELLEDAIELADALDNNSDSVDWEYFCENAMRILSGVLPKDPNFEENLRITFTNYYKYIKAESAVWVFSKYPVA